MLPSSKSPSKQSTPQSSSRLSTPQSSTRSSKGGVGGKTSRRARLVATYEEDHADEEGGSPSKGAPAAKMSIKGLKTQQEQAPPRDG